jgi:hypothetical protein
MCLTECVVIQVVTETTMKLPGGRNKYNVRRTTEDFAWLYQALASDFPDVRACVYE